MAVTVLNHIGECEGRPAEHLKNAIRYIPVSYTHLEIHTPEL